jgi:hypothetical protein
VDKVFDDALLRGVRPVSRLYRTTYAVRETGSTTRGLTWIPALTGLRRVVGWGDRDGDKDETNEQEEQPS